MADAAILSLSSGVMIGHGASSTSFWCRRWMEHSRSYRWMTFPCSSARTWNSMCLGLSRYFSMKTVASPNADWAMRRPASIASSRPFSSCTMCMPMPPPPALALTITG
ncbi:MAG: hypothetical protein A4E37_01729 [Methanoregulaceae archaeon PtaB.Bin056]|nr:MAG: hypothetical protein A4E37_01729 [Methanoregulaceae archaeon PtaB.Bin056]